MSFIGSVTSLGTHVRLLVGRSVLLPMLLPEHLLFIWNCLYEMIGYVYFVAVIIGHTILKFIAKFQTFDMFISNTKHLKFVKKKSIHNVLIRFQCMSSFLQQLHSKNDNKCSDRSVGSET